MCNVESMSGWSVMQMSWNDQIPVGRRPWLLPWLTALTLGAVLTLLAVLLYYRMGGQSEANIPLRWSGGDVQLIGGQGNVTSGGLEIPHIGPQGIVLWTPPRWINAGLYGEWVWDIAGLDGRHPLQPIWRTPDGQVRQAAQATVANAGQVDLRTEPDWRGTVIAVGLFIPGPLSKPVTVRRLELRPALLTTGEWLNRLWEEWTTREDWSQRSINFAAGTTSRLLASPVLLTALGFSLSGLLYAIWLFSAGQQWRPGPFAALFLLGWLLLDLRWQWELTGRLEQTVERFAGKDETDRRLADLDGEFYRFLLEVRQRLPEKPARLLIVSHDPSGFLAGRARYHLLPHNGYMGFSRPPDTAQVGDYVLLLAPLPGVRYDRQGQALEWENGRLLVEMQYSAPTGTLLRVRGK